MDWPSKRVQPGGIFHPHKIVYSKETHDLLKLLMEEQKLTMLQRNTVNYHLRNGDPLPPPGSASSTRSGYLKNSQSYEDQLAIEIMKRAKVARKRSYNEIKASGAYECERYVPVNNSREPSDKQKLRLQENMSGLKQHPELDGLNVHAKHKFKRNTSQTNEYPDPIAELVNEIYERANWLSEMEQLGEGKNYRNLIQSQIAEKLRLIKKLEKDKQNKLQQENDIN